MDPATYWKLRFKTLEAQSMLREGQDRMVRAFREAGFATPPQICDFNDETLEVTDLTPKPTPQPTDKE